METQSSKTILEKKMTVEQAITILLKPVYEKYSLGETIDEFVDNFLKDGGKINIQMPSWLIQRVQEKNDVEIPTSSALPPRLI
jgi:hypothetical protein